MTLPVRILIVDDEPDTVGLIEITLKPAGYLIEKAFNGEDALERIRSESYDLLLLDIMMPEVDGFEIIETLRAESAPLPPFLFLTAKGRLVDVERGQALGAAGYLVKPATRGELLDAIQASINEG
ncbi:MAG: response regulator [Anaerolineales bacterium]|nr:response regulator [Anaerolineales bacterium]